MTNNRSKHFECDHDWNKINNLLEKGLYEEGERLIEVIHNLEDLWLKIECNLGQGNYKEAEKTLEYWKYRISNSGSQIYWDYYEALIKLSKNLKIEAKTILENGLKSNMDAIDDKISTMILLALAQIHRSNADYEQSIKILSSLEKKLDPKQEKFLLAQVCQHLGNVFFIQGKLQEALVSFTSSLRLFNEIPNLRSIAGINNNIAMVYHYQGRIEVSLSYHQVALDIFKREINDKRFIAMVLNNMANLYQLQGKMQKSLAFHSQALEYRQELGNQALIAMSLNNLGSIYFDLGLYDRALKYQSKSLEIRKKHFNALEFAPTLVDKARILMEKKINITNSGLMKEFEKYLYNSNSESITGYKTILEAMIEQQNRDYSKAITKWEKATRGKGLSYHYQVFIQEEMIMCHYYNWMNNKRLENKKKLDSQIKKWKELCEEKNLTSNLCKIHLLKSKLHIASFDYTEAQIELKNCIKKASESGLPLHEKLASEDLIIVNQKIKKIMDLTSLTKNPYDLTKLNEFETYLRTINKIFGDFKKD